MAGVRPGGRGGGIGFGCRSPSECRDNLVCGGGNDEDEVDGATDVVIGVVVVVVVIVVVVVGVGVTAVGVGVVILFSMIRTDSRAFSFPATISSALTVILFRLVRPKCSLMACRLEFTCCST